MRECLEVAIIGGGPAGAATSIALAGKGRSVLLIERSHYELPGVGETLPPRARLPLQALGLWERFTRARHLPSPGTLAAWGGPNLTSNDWILNPYGTGWHLDRRRFDNMLARRAAEEGACVRRDTRLLRVERKGAGEWRIETDRGKQRARFLVDATGRMGFVARQLGIKRINCDRLVAVVGFGQAASQEARTLVEAARDGWWYSARLPDARLIVAYMTDADLLPAQKSDVRRYWEQELKATEHTRARVSGETLDMSLRTLAANSYRLARVAGEDWLAVGDAAYALDPLSSQGIFQALESGLAAGRAIDRSLRGNTKAREGYGAWAEGKFARYLEQRADYYGREGRWLGEPFWKRRQAISLKAIPFSAPRSHA